MKAIVRPLKIGKKTRKFFSFFSKMDEKLERTVREEDLLVWIQGFYDLF
tara:strand:+ start:517 stop:663 length:147 start_codon:yes stop_codon:yes gene_type:complete